MKGVNKVKGKERKKSYGKVFEKIAIAKSLSYIKFLQNFVQTSLITARRDHQN